MKRATGLEVFQWPEFKALAERLGIKLKDTTECLTITIPRNEVVLIAEDGKGFQYDRSGRDRHLSQNAAIPNIGMWRTEKPPKEDK